MKKHDEGFSFVILILAIAIVSVLVVTGLALANGNFSMKFTEEQHDRAVYSAESAVNEIRSGLEEDVALVVKECYTSILASAATIPENRLDTEFQYLIISDLDVRFTGKQNLEPGMSVVPTPENGVWANDEDNYNSHIEGYLVNTDGVTIVKYPEFEADYDNYTFTLKGLSVHYEDPNGVYSGTVTTDIKIEAPSGFQNIIKKDSDEDTYEEYSLIAENCLHVEYAIVDGNVYAGDNGINICKDSAAKQFGNDYSVVFNSDKVTTRGDIVVNKQGTMKVNKSTIYARDLRTANAGSLSTPMNPYTAINIDGNTYLKGDVSLNLSYADIVMAGKYYGYNNVGTADDSSFVVNASNVSANLEGLTEMLIGGNSYLEIPTSAEAYDVMMGESLTGKFTQSMYLVPSCCISIERNGERVNTSNPIKLSDLPTLQVDLTQNAIYGGIDLTQFVSSMEPKPYYTVCTTYAQGQSLDNNRVYIYIKFASEDKANDFALTYSALNPDYIDNRASSFKYGAITLGKNTVITTKGNVIENDAVDGIKIRKASSKTAFDTVSTWHGTQNNQIYNSLCSSLGVQRTDVTNDSLFDYMIDTSLLTGGNITVETGDVICDTGIYFDDNIVSKYSGDVFTVLVASGDVTIQRDFIGVILTAGNITCNSNVNVYGLLISGADIDLKAGKYSNMTLNEECPFEYIVELYDSRNEVRKFFKQLEQMDDNNSGIYDMDVRNYITYERWNTR